MRHLRKTTFAAMAVVFAALAGASSASATTLEVAGATQNGPITITASVDPGSQIVLSRTDGTLANTCNSSHTHFISTLWTNPVTGPLTGHTAKEKEEGAKPTDGLSFGGCTNPVTVHDPGTLYFEHEAGTTNANVFSENLVMTVATSLGFTVTCQTGAGTKTATLTGATNGSTNNTQHATIDTNAVVNCGFLLPSATLKGAYTVTHPTELGVSA